MLTERIIRGADCVDEGVQFLSALDRRFQVALLDIELVPLRLKNDGFPALLDAIVGQQISVASANSVWKRLEAANLIDQTSVQAVDPQLLRDCGLSRPKVKYAKALALADLDYDALRGIPSSDVIAELTKVTGIGQWSAEIYAMFSLGRADVFAHGDLALQESARVLFDLECRPTSKEMEAMAQAWSPWRSVAARILWAYYKVINTREGIRK